MPSWEEILTEVVHLADAAGLGVIYVVGLLLAAAVLLALGKRFGRLPRDPEPPPPPMAEWNTDPGAGAVVTPNDDPGGCGPGGCAG